MLFLYCSCSRSLSSSSSSSPNLSCFRISVRLAIMRPRWPPRRRWPPGNRMRDTTRGTKLIDSPNPSLKKPTSVLPPPSSDMGESVSPLPFLELVDDDHGWGECIWSTDEETSHLLLIPWSKTRSPLPVIPNLADTWSSEAALSNDPCNTEQVLMVGE